MGWPFPPQKKKTWLLTRENNGFQGWPWWTSLHQWWRWGTWSWWDITKLSAKELGFLTQIAWPMFRHLCWEGFVCTPQIFQDDSCWFSGHAGIFIPFPWSQRGCGSRSHENWASKLRAFYLKKQSWNSTRHKLPRTASDHQIFLQIIFVNFGSVPKKREGYGHVWLDWNQFLFPIVIQKWSAKTLQISNRDEF